MRQKKNSGLLTPFKGSDRVVYVGTFNYFGLVGRILAFWDPDKKGSLVLELVPPNDDPMPPWKDPDPPLPIGHF